MEKLEECYSDGDLTDTTINDIMWFDFEDMLYENYGYISFEDEHGNDCFVNSEEIETIVNDEYAETIDALKAEGKTEEAEYVESKTGGWLDFDDFEFEIDGLETNHHCSISDVRKYVDKKVAEILEEYCCVFDENDEEDDDEEDDDDDNE